MATFSPTNSLLLHGNRPFVLADGKDSATVKIRLRDTDNNPIAGGFVQLYIDPWKTPVDPAEIKFSGPVKTDVDGNALAYVTATTPGNYQIYARTLVDATAEQVDEAIKTNPEALKEFVDSSANSESFAAPLTINFFSRDIEVAPKLQDTQRNVRLTWAVSRQYYNDIDGIRVRITATEANLMPTKIFAYLLQPLAPGGTERVGTFDHVCSSVDLEDYPEDTPLADVRPEWFRLDYVDVLLRSKEEVREFVNAVLEDVQILKNTLDVADDLLPSGDVWIGTPPA
jgi:hypothetical protein